MNKIKRSASLIVSSALCISAAAAGYAGNVTALTDNDEMYFTSAFSTANTSGKSVRLFCDKNTGDFYVHSGSFLNQGGGGSYYIYMGKVKQNGRSEVEKKYRWKFSYTDENRGEFYIDDIQVGSDQNIADSFRDWLNDKNEIIVDETNAKSGTPETLFYYEQDFVREYNRSGSQTRTIYLLENGPEIRLHCGLELSSEDEELVGIRWQCDDESVAKVDNYGYLSPQSSGTCRVTASLADSGVCLGEIEVNVFRDQQEMDDYKNPVQASAPTEPSVQESEESYDKYHFDGDPKKSEYDFEKLIPARKYDTVYDIFCDSEFIDNVLEYEKELAEFEPMETLHRINSETSVISYTLRAQYDTAPIVSSDDPKAISMAREIANDIAYSVKRHLTSDQTVKVRVIVCNYDNTKWFDKTFEI